MENPWIYSYLMIDSYNDSGNSVHRELAVDWQSVLHRIKATITSEMPGSQILLFGSHARSGFTGASDYDLLIVTQESIEVRKKMPLKTRIRKLLLAQGIFSDILIQNSGEIERKRHLPGHIVRNAIKEKEAIAL